MRNSLQWPLVLTIGFSVVACGGGGTTATNTTTTSGIAPNISAPDGARLLASQCFQCHGMNGVSATGIESIAGDSVASLVEEMLEMKYSTEVDIMHYQAKGYSEDEIRSMAQYLSALPQDPNGDND
ncbi:Cytochrome c553 [Thiothrix caldifontis]|uniref:Cytochrome c553 n=1 Tax=Thiothrix caldifontis TaxID=525918 RepID=A0A1H3VG12_9GAMM|nr:c-type cytochrome [Thiothrix caldifontis]SDZ73670.1 Cytochrome c553 [Thiothrix caldifontis]